LFNATGGGFGRMAAEGRIRRVRPDVAFTPEDTANPERIEEQLGGWRTP
jgi:hypothetical protein